MNTPEATTSPGNILVIKQATAFWETALCSHIGETAFNDIENSGGVEKSINVLEALLKMENSLTKMLQ